MTAMSFERRVSAHTHHDPCTACDAAPPNHRAHRLWFIIVVMAVVVAAGVAMIGGMVKGLTDMGGAFTSANALLQTQSWDQFFAGFGRVSALVLIAVVAVAVLRRKARKPAKK